MEEFEIDCEVVAVVEDKPLIEGQPAPQQPGALVRCKMIGNEAISDEYFVPLFAFDEESVMRQIKVYVEDRVMRDFAERLLKQLAGSPAERLQWAVGRKLIVDGMCGNCMKRTLGLLPREAAVVKPGIETIAEAKV